MSDVTERACPVCGVTFTPYRKGALVQTYCSLTCVSRADIRRLPERQCDECGGGFRPKDRRGRFCSPRCSSSFNGRERLPGRRGRRLWQHRSGRKYCSDGCRPLRGRLSSTVPWAECSWCGRWFVGRQGRKYCSKACLVANHPRKSRVSEIAYGDCRRCGGAFVIRKGKARAYCSETCAKRARKNFRKHLKRASAGGESFTLREIAERDGWRCHICGRKVPDREYKARDRDPTLDHLVPLSAGGAHLRKNVALAHNRCNWERNVGGDVQLRLVG